MTVVQFPPPPESPYDHALDLATKAITGPFIDLLLQAGCSWEVAADRAAELAEACAYLCVRAVWPAAKRAHRPPDPDGRDDR